MNKAELSDNNKLFVKEYILIVIICGLGRICNHMQAVTIPLYVQSIGYSATLAGLMTTVYTIVSVIFRPFIGVMLDSKGRWIIFMLGTGLFAFSSGMFGYMNALWLLFTVRLLHGLGFSAHTTSINTMGTDVIPESRLAEGIGYMGLTNSISTAIAPALALFLAEAVGYNRTFLSIAGIAIAATLIGFFIRYEKKRPVAEKSEFKRLRWSDLYEEASLLPSIVILVMAGANVALSTFLASYGNARGMESVGFFFTVSAITMAVARLTCGWFSRRIGEKNVMNIGLVLCLVGYILIFLADGNVALWAAGAVYGFGYGVVYPLLNAMAVVNAPSERRGSANATFLMFMDLGIGVGSFVWGLTIDLIGIRWLYLLCSGCAFISLIINQLPVFSKLYSKQVRGKENVS